MSLLNTQLSSRKLLSKLCVFINLTETGATQRQSSAMEARCTGGLVGGVCEQMKQTAAHEL